MLQAMGQPGLWEFPVNQHMIFLSTTDEPANVQAQVEGVYYTPTFVDGRHLT